MANNIKALASAAGVRHHLALQNLVLGAATGYSEARLPAHIRALLDSADLSHELIGIKATDNDLQSYHNSADGHKISYGNSLHISAPDYKAQDNCGNGLHFCLASSAASLVSTIIHPKKTKGYYHIAAISVEGDNSVIISPDAAGDTKIKARDARILFSGRGNDVVDILKALFHNAAGHREQDRVYRHNASASNFSQLSRDIAKVSARPR